MKVFTLLHNRSEIEGEFWGDVEKSDIPDFARATMKLLGVDRVVVLKDENGMVLFDTNNEMISA